MLLQLSDRTHSVYSGFAVVGFGEEHTGIDETRVTMRSITLVEAAAYSATGEPLDKAGAYAIQGEAIRFITAVEGSRLNVAGLPLETLLPLLADRGIRSGSVATDTSDAIAP
jgi:septum formation protein